MARHISILRGINVSGKNIIRMADLVALYEALGLAEIETYIQSGNVVFSSTAGTADSLAKKIELAIKQEYGFEVPVFVRSKSYLQHIVKNNPFTARSNVDISRLHVTFLEDRPDTKLVNGFDPAGLGKDEFSIDETVVYIYAPGGYGKSRLSNSYLEKQLGVRATTRNWKTVNRLLVMLNR